MIGDGWEVGDAKRIAGPFAVAIAELNVVGQRIFLNLFNQFIGALQGNYGVGTHFGVGY